MHFRTEVKPLAVTWETLPHNDGRDDGIDLNAGNILTARCERAGNVPTAPGPNHQCFPPGPQDIREPRTVVSEIEFLFGSQVFEIEVGNAGCRIAIDNDALQTRAWFGSKRNA